MVLGERKPRPLHRTGRTSTTPRLNGRRAITMRRIFFHPTQSMSCPAQLGWLRGPGYADLDLSLQKNFQLTERYKLQFRSDFVNAFNHVNLNAPNMNLGGTMGQITSAQDPRNIQFALKFYY